MKKLLIILFLLPIVVKAQFKNNNTYFYNALNYGMVNDAQFAPHVSINSGSDTIVCLNCTFLSNAKIGQYARIDTAGTAGFGLYGTITHVVDNQHITLSVTATNGTKDKYIVWGTDNTSAMQGLLNFMASNGGGTLFMPTGGYIFAGTLQQNVGGVVYNCQIILPVAGFNSTPALNNRTGISIVGAAIPNLSPMFLIADSSVAHTGTWLESIIDPPSVASNSNAPALFGTAGSGSYAFNYTYYQWTNITIFSPQNSGSGGPDITPINCNDCASPILTNVNLSSDGFAQQATPPGNSAAALIGPSIGGEAFSRADNVGFNGFKYGIIASDHFIINNGQFFLDSFAIVASQGSYPINIEKAGVGECTVTLYIPNSTILGNVAPGVNKIYGFIQVEDYATSPYDGMHHWYNHYVNVIDSGNNCQYGELTYFSNRNDLFAKYNGKNIICTQLGQFGNFTGPNLRMFTLGDSATTSAGMLMGGNSAVTDSISENHSTTNFSGLSIKTQLASSPQMEIDMNNAGTLGNGVNGAASGRQIVFFDDVLPLRLGGIVGPTKQWVIAGPSLTDAAIVATQPTSAIVTELLNSSGQAIFGGGSFASGNTPTELNIVSSVANNSNGITAENTNSAGQSVLAVLNDRSSFGTYGQFFAGGTGADASLGHISGISRNDLITLFANGSSNSGLMLSEQQNKPLYLATNGSVRQEIFGGGNVAFNSTTDNSTAQIQITATGQPQQAWHYDATHYATAQVNSAGSLTIAPIAGQNINFQTTNMTQFTGNGTYFFGMNESGTPPVLAIGYTRGAALVNGYMSLDSFNNVTFPGWIASSSNSLGTIAVSHIEYNADWYVTNSQLNRVAIGGPIADFTTDAANSGTAETDLYTYTTKANTLNQTGDKLTFTVTGTTVGSATATDSIKFYFGGNIIYTTGSITIASNGSFKGSVDIIRTGASTARSSVSLTVDGVNITSSVQETNLTGLTFSGTNILKVTGTSSGTGGGSNAIVARMGTISWAAAAAN